MGSVFLYVIPLVALFILGLLASPFFFIPAGVVLLVALIASPVMGLLNRGGSGGGGSSGVPTTDEASYEPVQQPPN